jgi:hypothetical protein
MLLTLRRKSEIAELEVINELLLQSEIECYFDGKYNNEIRETIIALVTVSECRLMPTQQFLSYIFSLTRPGLEPTIYPTRGEHYTTDAVISIWKKYHVGDGI